MAELDKSNMLYEGKAKRLYATDNPEQSAANLPSEEEGAVIGMDPMVDGDGRPSSGSPAIGAGQASADATGDLDGACYADPPTIGAFAAVTMSRRRCRNEDERLLDAASVPPSEGHTFHHGSGNRSRSGWKRVRPIQ